MKIVELLQYPQFTPTVVQWIQKTWPDDRDYAAIEKRLCGERKPDKLPVAFIAVDKDHPIGFSSLTLFEKGIAEGRPHWIDSLYVEPSHRGQGIALKLIQRAESKAKQMGIKQLFVLTNIADFYKKAGWLFVEEDPKGSILTKTL